MHAVVVDLLDGSESLDRLAQALSSRGSTAPSREHIIHTIPIVIAAQNSAPKAAAHTFSWSIPNRATRFSSHRVVS
jgi:MoxR-like ATPase